VQAVDSVVGILEFWVAQPQMISYHLTQGGKNDTAPPQW
jgi:hypothetical protein